MIKIREYHKENGLQGRRQSQGEFREEDNGLCVEEDGYGGY